MVASLPLPLTDLPWPWNLTRHPSLPLSSSLPATGLLGAIGGMRGCVTCMAMKPAWSLWTGHLSAWPLYSHTNPWLAIIDDIPCYAEAGLRTHRDRSWWPQKDAPASQPDGKGSRSWPYTVRNQLDLYTRNGRHSWWITYGYAIYCSCELRISGPRHISCSNIKHHSFQAEKNPSIFWKPIMDKKHETDFVYRLVDEKARFSSLGETQDSLQRPK